MGKDHTENGQEIQGLSYPLGATCRDGGVNFCLFSKNCTGVDLLLFEHKDDINPAQISTLDPVRNHTHQYWHIFVPGLKPGQLYGYRVSGLFEPNEGLRYDSARVLLDPYAKSVAIPSSFSRESFKNSGHGEVPAMKGVVTDLSAYDWENDRSPGRNISQSVIYELHVAGFTKHPSSGVSPGKSGTYAGLMEKIPYLLDLGINTVELLPVFLFDSQDCPDGLTNYWGYCPVSFFAPHQDYCVVKDDPLAALDEFRDMVKALHRAGIEVILDVVYNHTAEGNESGPVYGLKGIDNSIYYLLEKDRSRYSNYTGTGNTLNANHPVVRRMITDSLHFWVNDMHVDGFRFDLASILARDETGRPLINPPVLWDIDTDPMLAGIKMIAEAWDAAGLYQVGSFIGDRWKEWNGRFRDDVRKFFRGDNGIVSSFASRLLGSPDLYGHEIREPEQSINFITCHDGFTLNDLVSYQEKHNQDNKESNRDGSDDNLSWNCGMEGPSNEPSVEALRSRQVRNFFAITLLSLGAPMLMMGDEVRRTQQGNNNAYCQDNTVSWFNWHLYEKNADLHRFVKMIIMARLERDSAMTEYNMSLQKLLKYSNISWHGIKLNQPDWSYHSHCIGLTLHSLSGNSAMHWMINAHSEPLEFEIPRSDENVPYRWTRWIDTGLHNPDDINSWNEGPVITGGTYTVLSHSLVVLVTVIREKAVISSVPG